MNHPGTCQRCKQEKLVSFITLVDIQTMRAIAESRELCDDCANLETMLRANGLGSGLGSVGEPTKPVNWKDLN